MSNAGRRGASGDLSFRTYCWLAGAVMCFALSITLFAVAVMMKTNGIGDVPDLPGTQGQDVNVIPKIFK